MGEKWIDSFVVHVKTVLLPGVYISLFTNILLAIHWYHSFRKHWFDKVAYLVSYVIDHNDVYKRDVQLFPQNNEHQALIGRAYWIHPSGFKPDFSAPRPVGKVTCNCASIGEVPIASHKVLYTNSKRSVCNEEFNTDILFVAISLYWGTVVDSYAGTLKKLLLPFNVDVNRLSLRRWKIASIFPSSLKVLCKWVFR